MSRTELCDSSFNQHARSTLLRAYEITRLLSSRPLTPAFSNVSLEWRCRLVFRRSIMVESGLTCVLLRVRVIV